MDQSNTCKYCNKKFTKISTLNMHVCVKKQRHQDINQPGCRLGLKAFQLFYKMKSNSAKEKTSNEFIDSTFYIDFAKFGNHLASLKPVHIEKYIEYVIMNNVPLKDWTKDIVYDLYVEDLVKKEPAESGTERTITTIMEWCTKNEVAFGNFFMSIHPNEAAHLIRTGRISPWVLYLSGTGEQLMNRFNEDHAKMIRLVIDAGFWMKKFKKNPEDVEYIQTMLSQVSI